MMARQQTNRNNGNTTQSSARERAIDAYDSARERTLERVDGSPLLALGGGLAFGALLAALLPKTRTEERLLGPVGGRITETARTAADAAREAGREKLSELNITRDAGRGAVQSLVDGITEAARTSGKAAVEAARNKG
jgi:hypothetical protein